MVAVLANVLDNNFDARNRAQSETLAQQWAMDLDLPELQSDPMDANGVRQALVREQYECLDGLSLFVRQQPLAAAVAAIDSMTFLW